MVSIDCFHMFCVFVVGVFVVGLVSGGVSPTVWEEGASLVLIDHPSNDGVTIKVHYLVDFYYINQPCTPSVSVGLV